MKDGPYELKRIKHASFSFWINGLYTGEFTGGVLHLRSDGPNDHTAPPLTVMAMEFLQKAYADKLFFNQE